MSAKKDTENGVADPESQVEVVSLEKLEERIMPSAISLLTPEFIQSLVCHDDFTVAHSTYDSWNPKK